MFFCWYILRMLCYQNICVNFLVINLIWKVKIDKMKQMNEIKIDNSWSWWRFKWFYFEFRSRCTFLRFSYYFFHFILRRAWRNYAAFLRLDISFCLSTVFWAHKILIMSSYILCCIFQFWFFSIFYAFTFMASRSYNLLQLISRSFKNYLLWFLLF